MSGPRTTRTRTIVMLALLAGTAVLLFGCPKKSPKTQPTIGGPMITIEDEHSGIWMPFDNFFTKPPAMDPKDFKNKRAGFLFQSGRFFRYQDDGSILYYDEANAVLFSSGITSVSLTRGTDWDWINIVGDYSAHPDPPITWDYAGVLFPNKLKTTVCDVSDACVVPDAKLAPPASCSDTLDKQARPCTRLRSLHAYFEAGGIITYWQGEHGYDLSVGRRSDALAHNRYVFKLKDPISVEIWLNGARNSAAEARLASLGKNLSITIKEPPESPHEDTYDPPPGPTPK